MVGEKHECNKIVENFVHHCGAMQALSLNINQPVLGRGPALNSFPRHDLGHYLPLVLSKVFLSVFL